MPYVSAHSTALMWLPQEHFNSNKRGDWKRQYPKWNATLNKRWNWSSCTKLALTASWTHGLIFWIPYRRSIRLSYQTMSSTRTLYSCSNFISLFSVHVSFLPLPSSVVTFALSEISHRSFKAWGLVRNVCFEYFVLTIPIHTYTYALLKRF